MTDVDVRNHPEEGRYVARVGGSLAGSAYYDTADDLIAFTHTEVDDAFEGQGVGSAIVRAALDDVRGRGLRVIPRCPFVRAFIQRHEEYADLLD